MKRTRSDGPGWTNGGLGSHGALAVVDKSKGNSRNVIGISAFSMVVTHPAGGGALPELAWFYCASSFELGMTSSFDAIERHLREGTQSPCIHCKAPLFQHFEDENERRAAGMGRTTYRCGRMLARFEAERSQIRISGRDLSRADIERLKADESTFMYVNPTHAANQSNAPPGHVAMYAATEQRRILRKLGAVPPMLRAGVLQTAYEDRRCPARLVGRFGLGLAPIVMKAQWSAGEASDTGYDEPGIGTLDVLTRMVKRYWPTWMPDEDSPIAARIMSAADQLLWTGHAHYGAHVLEDTPVVMAAPRTVRRKRRGRKPPELQQAGARGSKKRQLVTAKAA